jgi:NAD(P)-dependent dehydrogenase (short-subunit alcohol dehydrogenase family)
MSPAGLRGRRFTSPASRLADGIDQRQAERGGQSSDSAERRSGVLFDAGLRQRRNAKAFPKMRINCVDPGYTATDMNGNSGLQTAAEAAGIIAQMACRGSGNLTGTFSDAHGPLPW